MCCNITSISVTKEVPFFSVPVCYPVNIPTMSNIVNHTICALNHCERSATNNAMRPRQYRYNKGVDRYITTAQTLKTYQFYPFSAACIRSNPTVAQYLIICHKELE